MEPIATHVAYRQAQLRELAADLRHGRRASRPARTRTLRIALGRRLVLLGIALLDGARPGPAVVR